MKPGIKTLKDLVYLKSQKPKLYEDIGKLRQAKKGTKRITEFKQFKKKYSELFDGTLSKWNRSVIYDRNRQTGAEKALAQIRRAYNQAIKAKQSIHQQAGLQLKNAYQQIPTKGPQPPQPPKPSYLIRILSRYGLGNVQKTMRGYETDFPISDPLDVQAVKNSLQLSQNEIDFLKSNNITKYRLILEITFDSGNKGWISTKRLPIPSFKAFEDLFTKADSYIISQNFYEYQDIIEIFDEITGITIMWS
ncbi:MAG: hypothetical protein R6U52_06000 [Kosmotogaceae bacterium]